MILFKAAEAEEPSLDIATPAMVAEADKEDEAFDPSPTPQLEPPAAPALVPVPALNGPLGPVPVRGTAPTPMEISSPSVPPKPINEAPAAVMPLAPVTAILPALVEGPAPPPDYVVLRILEDMPPIAGPDRNYELKKEDMVSLPTNIAKALIARKKAVKVQLPEGSQK